MKIKRGNVAVTQNKYVSQQKYMYIYIYRLKNAEKKVSI